MEKAQLWLPYADQGRELRVPGKMWTLIGPDWRWLFGVRLRSIDIDWERQEENMSERKIPPRGPGAEETAEES